MNPIKEKAEIILKPESFGIEQSRADQIKAIFLPMSEMIKGFETRFNEVNLEAGKEITKETTAKAKRLRLDIAKVRIETEKARKEAKEESLRQGKAIDGTANILKYAIQEKEAKLKKIEDYFENLERERIQELQLERAMILNEFEVDGEFMELGTMSDEVWENYLTGVKTQYNNRKEAEAKAEAERIAKEKARLEEEKRIRAENERLKAEAEKVAREREKERKKAEAERLKLEAEAKKKADEAAEKLKAEQEEKARIEAELKAKREAEEKRIREENERIEAESLAKAEAEKRARLAPDKEKLEVFAKSLSSIELPKLSTKEAKAIVKDIEILMAKIQDHIRTKSSKL